MKKIIAIFLLFVTLICVSGCGTNKVKEAAFDYYVECTTEDQIKEISGKDYINKLFSFTLMIFQRPGYENPMMGQLALMCAPSFENIEITEFNKDNLVKCDEKIMNSPEQHPILIDSSLADTEKISVGDKFYQDTKIDDKTLEFTVAGIYRHTQLFAQFEAVALINDQIKDIFSDKVEELGYTNSYIKAKDVQKLKDHLDNEFMPELMTKEMSEEDIAAVTREEISLFYEDHKTHMLRMKGEE